MKKLYILIFFSLINQFSFGQFIAITPKAGISFSKARYLLFEKEYLKPGLLLGIEADFNLLSKLVFRPELVFEQKGTLQKAEGVDLSSHPIGIIKMHYAWNYISIPLILKYKPFSKIKSISMEADMPVTCLEKPEGCNIPKPELITLKRKQRY